MRLPQISKEKPLTAHVTWAGLPNPPLPPGDRKCFLPPAPVRRGSPLARQGHPQVYSPFPSPHVGHRPEVRAQWPFNPPPPLKSPVFIPLHPREGIYCLNPEMSRKTFLPDMSSAWPQRAASCFYRNKINIPRGPLLPDGKASLARCRGVGPEPAPLSDGSAEGRCEGQDGDPPRFGSSLDLPGRGVFCLRTKLCAACQVGRLL